MLSLFCIHSILLFDSDDDDNDDDDNDDDDEAVRACMDIQHAHISVRISAYLVPILTLK